MAETAETVPHPQYLGLRLHTLEVGVVDLSPQQLQVQAEQVVVERVVEIQTIQQRQPELLILAAVAVVVALEVGPARQAAPVLYFSNTQYHSLQ